MYGESPYSDAYPTGHGWCASARVHVHTHVQMFHSVRISGSAGRIALKFGVGVGRDQLAMRFTLLMGVVHLHVRTFFSFLGAAGRIALKFGMFLETS